MIFYEENEEQVQENPSWIDNLIERLMQVLTKLLIKFGIKIMF